MSDKKNKSLKPGWRQVKFGDVVQLSKARSQDPLADGIERYVGLEHLEPGDLRIRRWGNVADGVTFTSIFQPGQVLFGKRRAYQRKVAVADFSGVCSGDIYVLETKDSKVLLPELLPFICQTDAFFDHAVGTSAGSLSPRTNWTSLADFEFVLPPPDAQVQIRERLASAQAAVDELWQLVDSLDALVKSFRESHFAGLPPETFCRLDCAVAESAYGPRFSATLYSDSGTVKTIRTTDMPEFGMLNLATAPIASVPKAMAIEHRLLPGDFLISRTGFTSGRAATFQDPPAEEGFTYIPAAFIVRLRLRAERLLSAYLVEYIQSIAGWSGIRRIQRGTQQLNISASALIAQRVPMPSPTEQETFLTEMRSLVDARTMSSQRLSSTRRVFAALCNDAFVEGQR